MSDAIKDTVNGVLLQAIDVARAGGEFLKEQIPDLAQQLLKYNAIKDSVIIIAMCTILIIVSAAVRRAINNWEWLHDRDLEFPVGFGFVVVGLVMCPFIIAGLIDSICDLIKIVAAPKIWLLEYAANLVK